MAQVLKLKRTAVSGKTPTTSHLELGELAINTFDGRIFLKKDSGTPIITEILTTNTGNDITGSLNLNGDINANNLTLSGNATIDGNITLGGNITIGDNVADIVTVTAGFSGSLIPDTTSLYDLGSSTKKWNKLHVVTASADYFIGDGSGLTNVVAEVSQVTTVTSSFSNQDDTTVTHNFNSRNIHVSVYDNSNQLIIPETIELVTVDSVNVTLSTPVTGYIVVSKGGHIVSGSANDASNLNGQPGSYYLDYGNFTSVPSGIVSGSSQITDLTTYKETVSGNSTYSITHNLNEEYPIVQAYNTTTKRQEVPSIIESTSANGLDITFSSNFAGIIVVKK